jgi:hypothetical protein
MPPKSNTHTKPSVQLAVSTSAIFWSVAWGAFVREIIDAPSNVLSYSFLQLPKKNVIIFLVFLLAIFTFLFVRWLARIQDWTMHVELVELVKRTTPLLIVLITIAQLIRVLVEGFQISSEWAIYGSWAIWIWPLIPFMVAIIPESP